MSAAVGAGRGCGEREPGSAPGASSHRRAGGRGHIGYTKRPPGPACGTTAAHPIARHHRYPGPPASLSVSPSGPPVQGEGATARPPGGSAAPPSPRLRRDGPGRDREPSPGVSAARQRRRCRAGPGCALSQRREPPPAEDPGRNLPRASGFISS